MNEQGKLRLARDKDTNDSAKCLEAWRKVDDLMDQVRRHDESLYTSLHVAIAQLVKVCVDTK